MPARALLLRAVLGFGAGLALWWTATPVYDRFLAASAEALIRPFERPRATRLYAEERRIVIDRSDFDSRSERPSLPADDLTFDVILLVTLAATSRGLFSDRGVRRLLLVLAILAVVHVLALVCEVKALYATRLGPWSVAHYGPIARNIWATLTHFYRVVGCFAAPFLLWWMLLRPEPAAISEPSPRPGPSRGRPSRGGGRASRRRGKG